jgi:hypothetical protein
MTSYNIKLVSMKNAIILVISSLSIFIFFTRKLFPNGNGGNSQLIIWLAIVVLAYFAWQKFVIGRTAWIIDDEKVSINWIKKFAWSDGENIILKWEEISGITRGRDPSYYILKIKLVSGKTWRFIHDPLVTRDDFNEMLMVLYKTLNDKKILVQK